MANQWKENSKYRKKNFKKVLYQPHTHTNKTPAVFFSSTLMYKFPSRIKAPAGKPWFGTAAILRHHYPQCFATNADYNSNSFFHSSKTVDPIVLGLLTFLIVQELILQAKPTCQPSTINTITLITALLEENALTAEIFCTSPSLYSLEPTQRPMV